MNSIPIKQINVANGVSNKPVPKPANRIMPNPTNRLMPKSMNRPANRPIPKPMNKPMNKPMPKPMNKNMIQVVENVSKNMRNRINSANKNLMANVNIVANTAENSGITVMDIVIGLLVLGIFGCFLYFLYWHIYEYIYPYGEYSTQPVKNIKGAKEDIFGADSASVNIESKDDGSGLPDSAGNPYLDLYGSRDSAGFTGKKYNILNSLINSDDYQADVVEVDQPSQQFMPVPEIQQKLTKPSPLYSNYPTTYEQPFEELNGDNDTNEYGDTNQYQSTSEDVYNQSELNNYIDQENEYVKNLNRQVKQINKKRIEPANIRRQKYKLRKIRERERKLANKLKDEENNYNM